MYAILSSFLLIILLSFMQLSLSFVFSVDDERFFVVPEDEFFNPGDYGGESSLSADGGGSYSEKFKSEDELYNTNPEKFVDSVNFTELNFALAGDWGCTKNTAKTVQIIQNHDLNLFSILEIHHMKRI